MEVIPRPPAPMRAQAAPLEEAERWLTPDSVAEEKLDGCRAMLVIGATRSRFTNDRSAGDRSSSFPDLAGIAIPELAGTILDGEFLAPPVEDELRAPVERSTGWFNSKPSVSRMTRIAYGRAPQFHVFDILAVSAAPATRHPYAQRRAWLEDVVSTVLGQFPDSGIEIVPQMPATPATLSAVLERGGEGIVIKERSGLYICGKRSAAWRKIKAVATVDVFLTGKWRAGKGARDGALGSVEVAVTRNDGSVRSLGFVTVKPNMVARYTDPGTSGLRPEFTGTVWEIQANGVRDDGLRHPRYSRARAGKSARDCGEQQLSALPQG